MNVEPYIPEPEQHYRIEVPASEYRLLRRALVGLAQNHNETVDSNREAARLHRLLAEAEG